MKFAPSDMLWTFLVLKLLSYFCEDFLLPLGFRVDVMEERFVLVWFVRHFFIWRMEFGCGFMAGRGQEIIVLQSLFIILQLAHQ
jgi:hypothetical protein